MKNVVIILAVFCMSGIAMYGQAGTIDPSFGINGRVSTDFRNSDDRAVAVAVQPDGKIVVTGTTNIDTNSARNERTKDFATVRYNANGSPDSTFGVNGKVITDIQGDRDTPVSVVVLPDGKILVAGRSIWEPNAIWYYIALVRYKSNGTLDSSFGKKGIALGPAFGTGYDGIQSLVMQSDGKILIGGHSTFNSELRLRFTLWRFKSDGTPDSSFGSNGLVGIKIGSENVGNELCNKLLVQPDGKIIAIGSTELEGIALMRFNPNGSLDVTFGGNGIVTTKWGYNTTATDAALTSDGSVIVCGTRNVINFFVTKYTSRGALDRTFSNAGQMSLNNNYGGCTGITMQKDGKIFVVFPTYYSSIGIYRFSPAGAGDAAFGKSGVVEVPYEKSIGAGQDIAVQQDGKIIVIGSYLKYINNGEEMVPETIDYFVVRLHGAQTSGINEQDEETSLLTAFPNPASTTIEVAIETNASDETTLILYNSIGGEVRRYTVGAAAAGKRTVQFDVRDFPGGAYSLTFPTASGMSALPVIIEK